MTIRLEAHIKQYVREALAVLAAPETAPTRAVGRSMVLDPDTDPVTRIGFGSMLRADWPSAPYRYGPPLLLAANRYVAEILERCWPGHRTVRIFKNARVRR